MLNLADAVSRFIAAEPEQSFAKRAAATFTPRATLTAAATLAYLHLTTNGNLPAPDGHCQCSVRRRPVC